MLRFFTPYRWPYTLFVTLLVSSALFLLVMLGSAAEPAPSGADYAPGFAVRADHVQVVQVVPLAGASLRNPAASTARAAVVVPY